MKGMYLIMIAILIISVVVITGIIPQIDNEIRDSYLLYLVVVIEIIGMWAMRYFQLQDKQTDKKSGHTKRLNDKIFKPLLDLQITRHEDGNFKLDGYELSVLEKPQYGKRPNLDDLFDQMDGKEPNRSYPIERLSNPYYDWALDHLKKYPDLKKQFDKLKKLCVEQTEIHRTVSSMIKEKTINELKTQFPNFVENDLEKYNDSIYHYDKIEHIVGVQLQLGTTDPFFINEEWDDGVFALCSRHNGRPYLVSKEGKGLDIDKFKQFLKNVERNTELLEARKKYADLLDLSDNVQKEFVTNLALLVEDLDTGDILIKGKCKGCSGLFS